MEGRRILFIGAGNMAEALVRGLLNAGVCRPEMMRVTDINEERLKHFSGAYGVEGSRDNAAEIANADLAVLAVKPQALRDVLAQIGGEIGEGVLVVSIAAGVSISAIEGALRKGARIIRVMPNFPTLVGRGAAAFARGSRATDADSDTVSALFGCVGIVVEVAEPLLDAITALSGSGPAYVFYLVEAMLRAGAEMGLGSDTARKLTLATIEGSARMLSETGLDPRELTRRVASKGGTTEAALRVLREAGVLDNIVRAILAARDQSRKLST